MDPVTQPTRAIRSHLITSEHRVRPDVTIAERMPPGVSLTLALFVSGLMWLAIALGLRALLA